MWHRTKSHLRSLAVLGGIVAAFASCSPSKDARGIADERSRFESFVPMRQDPARDGLREVKPFFKRANRSEILNAVERACRGGRAGSSFYEPRTGEGYYVNCNPRNRQLLNGYIPAAAGRQPHSRP